jgi:hypothetical protein
LVEVCDAATVTGATPHVNCHLAFLGLRVMVETVSATRFCALLPNDTVDGGLPFTVEVSAIILGMSPYVVDAEATACSITCSMSLMVIDAMVD